MEVSLETTAGEIVLALFPALAPRTAAFFLSHQETDGATPVAPLAGQILTIPVAIRRAFRR